MSAGEQSEKATWMLPTASEDGVKRLACELEALGIAAAAKRAVRTKAFARNAGGCFWLNGKIAEQFYNAKVRSANAETPRIPQPPKKISQKKATFLKKKRRLSIFN